MTVAPLPAGANAPDVVAGWDDAHRHSPAPRHRRRLVVELVGGLQPADVLDAGCGQPLLLAELHDALGVPTYGCDISDAVMEDPRSRALAHELRVVDLEHEAWPGGRTFDVVVCSEVLEHIALWRAAVANVAAMARRHVLITVPGGRIRPMDRMVGHHRHFRPEELVAELDGHGFEPVLVRRWGFPLHSLYRWAISRLGAERMYAQFSGERRPYGAAQRRLSGLLYRAFFLNDRFHSGDQVIVLARRRDAA